MGGQRLIRLVGTPGRGKTSGHRSWLWIHYEWRHIPGSVGSRVATANAREVPGGVAVGDSARLSWLSSQQPANKWCRA